MATRASGDYAMQLIMVSSITKSLALLLATNSDGLSGTPPLPDEVSLAMRIENATDPDLAPGSRAILAFDLRHFGPVNFSPLYVVNEFQIPLEPNQPIRLSDVPGSDCSFFAYNSINPNYPGWLYVVTHDAPPFGVIQTCRVQLEVLEAARGGYQVTFFAGAGNGDLWNDPDYRNNRAVLHVARGQTIDAVPVAGKFALVLLSLCVVATGLRTLASNRKPLA